MFRPLFYFNVLLFVTDVLCKPDYIWSNEINGWLKLNQVPATFQEAFLRCYHEGAVIASPLDKNLANALLKIIVTRNVNLPLFLGTHALFSEGDFFSIEGVPLNDMPMTWGANGHDLNVGDCLTFNKYGGNYYSGTTSCTERHPFVCYKKFENDTGLNECGTFDDDYHLNERSGSCYKLHKDLRTWSEAHRMCAAEGGYLVVLNNAEEANIINEMLNSDNNKTAVAMAPIHIGLREWSKDPLQPVWTTIRGEKLEDVYNDWYRCQPHNNTNCGSLRQDGKLDDVDCNLRTKFVCEKDPEAVRFEFGPF